MGGDDCAGSGGSAVAWGRALLRLDAAWQTDEKMSPFQLAMIFLLNLEIAYCLPPLGLNLFISGFRFNRPVSSLYKAVMPFVGLLAVGLLIVSYVPWFSSAAVAADVAAVRAKAEKDGVPPRDAWMMECVQEDPNNPMPCSPEDRVKYPGAQLVPPAGPPAAIEGAPSEDVSDTSADAGCNPDFDDCSDAGRAWH